MKTIIIFSLLSHPDSYLIPKSLGGLKEGDAYFKVKKIKQFKFEIFVKCFGKKSIWNRRPHFKWADNYSCNLEISGLLFIVPLFVYLLHITFGILVSYHLMWEYVII